MRILLIGGNGFIGSPLAAELRGAGHQVAILHRGPSADIQADRNRLDACHHRLHEFAPDVIVDLILSSPEQAGDLMRVAAQHTRRVVALSSMDVYRAWGVMHRVEPGELEPLPLTEDSPVRTQRKLYPDATIQMMRSIFTWVDDGYDKVGVEEKIMNGDVPGAILRLPMIYGPGDPLHRFHPVLKRIADGRSSIILPDELAHWRAPRGFVDNVAHAIALAATSEAAAGRIYNVCEEPCLPELEWQKMIAARTLWQGKFVVLPRAQAPKHLLSSSNAEQHIVASSARIRAELGYEEIFRLHEAIDRTIAWERQNPPPAPAPAASPHQFDYAAEDAALR